MSMLSAVPAVSLFVISVPSRVGRALRGVPEHAALRAEPMSVLTDPQIGALEVCVPVRVEALRS